MADKLKYLIPSISDGETKYDELITLTSPVGSEESIDM
jgi:hypothetical protein